MSLFVLPFSYLYLISPSAILIPSQFENLEGGKESREG